MNANTPQAPAKKVIKPYNVWYRVSFGLIGLVMLLNAAGLVGWFTGHTLELFYGINGLLKETAMQHPYVILYMNYFGILASVAMIVVGAWFIRKNLTDKETAFDMLRNFMIVTICSLWSVPLFNAIVDLILTAAKVRSVLSYDIFDLGIDGLPMLVCTGLCLLVLILNIPLGDVPSDATIE